MKLQSKFISVLVIAWLLIISFTVISTKILVRRDYSKIENQFVKSDMERVTNAFATFIYAVDYLNQDWSGWDDSYNFINDLNPTYIQSNLEPAIFAEAKLSLLVYFDPEGRYKIGRFYDAAQQQFIPIPKALESYLQPTSSLTHHNLCTPFCTGIISIPEGYLAISSRPILKSTKKGPARGAIIMGRFFGKNELSKISQVTDLNVTLFSSSEILGDPALKNIYTELDSGKKVFIQPINDREIAGYTFLRDINDKPVGIFKAIMPRNVWQEGIKTSDFYILCFLVAGFIIFVLIWIVVKTSIIDRLLKVSNEVVEIGNNSKFASRVTLSGKDELSDLSQSVNNLLQIIETSQNELENRVRVRTEELENINRNLRDEIFKREKAEEQLRDGEKILDHMVHHDALTGLPNKALFNELLNRALADAKRTKRQLAVLFLDLDRFKKINDVLGHQAGDEYLQILANLFEQNLRGTDAVSRLGGDEFLFYISNFEHVADIEKVAQKILDIVALPQKIHNQQLQLSGSIGIAIFPSDGLFLEELISNADVAMYKAKESGKNQFHFFKEIFNINAKEELRLENDLRLALSKNEIQVYYQPIMDIADQKIVGVEALVRWVHPDLGLLFPDKFIPLAEKANLITSIGDFVLLRALKTYQNWKSQNLSLKFLTVNFSALQFRSQWFIEGIKSALKHTNFSGEELIVEITESVLMESEELSIEKLHSLKDLQVKIAIDDFGTGYSSLSYLQKFPINYLKIDREFIKRIPQDKDGCAITNAVIVLGHSLNLKVIAEGIETKDQMQYLQEHGCDLAQGFLLSRPVSENNIKDMLMLQSSNR